MLTWSRVSEVFRAQVADAQEKYRVSASRIGEGDLDIIDVMVGNGSRILVTVAVVPEEARPALGGALLVSVLRPWQRVYVLAERGGYLEWQYAMEKFGPPGAAGPRQWNGGDMYGVARAIADVTSRTLINVPGQVDEP